MRATAVAHFMGSNVLSIATYLGLAPQALCCRLLRRLFVKYAGCHSVHRKEIQSMRFRVSLLLIIVVFIGAPALAQKRNITEKDLFNFVWIGDPQVSPDGSR